MSSVFFNKGENCIAAGRLFVEESIYDEYLRRIVEEIGKMVSNPLFVGAGHRTDLRKVKAGNGTGLSDSSKYKLSGPLLAWRPCCGLTPQQLNTHNHFFFENYTLECYRSLQNQEANVINEN